MSKTSQNLKVLEKKIRQAAKIIEDLKHDKRVEKISPRRSSYTDLPLLKNLSSGKTKTPDFEKLFKERDQLKKRVQKVLDEIEKVIG